MTERSRRSLLGPFTAEGVYGSLHFLPRTCKQVFTGEGEATLNGLIPGPAGYGLLAHGLRKILISNPFVDRK